MSLRATKTAVLAALALAGASAGPSDALAAPCPNKPVARATLCLINGQRQGYGLHALRADRRLARSARAHSRDMVRRDYFSHTAPTGLTFLARVRRSGYLKSASHWLVGENIAWGTGVAASPGAIVQAWMQSPPHRKEILTPSYRQLGIGVARGVPGASRSGGETYTADFGVRH